MKNVGQQPKSYFKLKVKKTIESVCKQIKTLAMEFDDIEQQVKFIRMVLSNVVGNLTIQITNDDYLSNYKDNAKEIIEDIQRYFDYAIPLAIEQSLRTEKDDN